MKKMLKHMVFFLVVIAILSPVLGQAFNPAAHVYIAGKVARQVFPFTFDKTNLYYGSIAPDISSYVTGNWLNGFCETHYGFTKLPYAWWNPIQKAFAQGWQIHSEVGPWGADYYAHGKCFYFVPSPCSLGDCRYVGYVPEQAAALGEAFLKATGNDLLIEKPDLAHFAIEVAIDILLVDNKDHSLGQKLLSAALFRSPGVVNFLANVEDMGVTPEALSSAESTFRNLVINYATALTLCDPLRMALLGEIGVQIASAYGVDIDSATVQEILRTAVDQCKTTYYEPVDQAIKGIINNKSNLIK